MFISNAVRNSVLLVELLLQHVGEALQYLYDCLAASPTARQFYHFGLQCTTDAMQKMPATCSVLFTMAIRCLKSTLLGIRKYALPALWVILDLPEYVEAWVISTKLEGTSNAPSTSSDALILVRCSGCTDKGRCEEKRRAELETVWYCWSHVRQARRSGPTPDTWSLADKVS